MKQWMKKILTTIEEDAAVWVGHLIWFMIMMVMVGLWRHHVNLKNFEIQNLQQWAGKGIQYEAQHKIHQG